MTAVARMTWRALLDGSRSQVTAVARMTWRALAPSVVSLTLILPPHPIKILWNTVFVRNTPLGLEYSLRLEYHVVGHTGVQCSAVQCSAVLNAIRHT